jgi:hypothetical protein
MGYQLGVDLGTTFTAAAVARDGRAEAVSLGTNSMTVPSVVYLGDRGLVVGHAAQRRASTDPSRVAREFKRRLGDPTPILVGGSPVAAELLMARLLAWVVGEVAGWEGGPPDALAVTHPANWGRYKLDLFGQAIRHVGLRADQLVPEPVAAATFYASQRELSPGSVIAVYDLGGGTFDASLVRCGTGEFEIVGQPDGIERLGGIDFDHAVMRYTCQAADIDLDTLEPDDRGLTAALVQLREHCVLAKEALSADTAATIPVALSGTYTEVRLTRSEFEAMIRPALEETLVALRRTIASARLAPQDVTAVLLVGGSSRIPLVAQLVTADLRRPIAVDARPKDAIALGAALTVATNAVPATDAPAPVPTTSEGDPGPTGATTATGPSPPLFAAAGTTATVGPPAPAAPASAAPSPPLADRHSTTLPPPPDGPGPRHGPPPPPASGKAQRRPSRRVTAALLAGVVTVVGVLAWRIAADQADDLSSSVALAAGASHACVLQHGTVECWGANSNGQTSPPDDVELTAISAGSAHTCGIGDDRAVVCWGADDDLQATPPEDQQFVALAAGNLHTCGLHPDETVYCWGDGSDGQRTPQGERRFTSISSGDLHTCGIRTDRTITCWGTDRGDITAAPTGQFVALDAGGNHTCAIRTDDTVDCWGADTDDDASDPRQAPEGERFTGISVGNLHACGIRDDGTVACWGDDQFGQSSPLDGRFVGISAGGGYTCGMRADESVECWGGLSSPPSG